MADNQNETSAPAEEAVTVAAGEAVEGAVDATANPAEEYAEPTADRKADLADDLFGDEAQYVQESEAPAEGEPDGPQQPQGVIASHP